jgi:hypothetical protein
MLTQLLDSSVVYRAKIAPLWHKLYGAPEPVFVNDSGAQESITRIDSKESIPPVYVVWRASTPNRVAVPARQARN